MASNRKFMSALNALCEEKGIEKDVFLEMLKESIAKAYKKNYMVPEANVRVEINEKTGKKPIIATTLPVEINPFAIITAPINIII